MLLPWARAWVWARSVQPIWEKQWQERRPCLGPLLAITARVFQEAAARKKKSRNKILVESEVECRQSEAKKKQKSRNKKMAKHTDKMVFYAIRASQRSPYHGVSIH